MMTDECKRQLANLEQLAEYWKSVEPDTVYLERYRERKPECGTLYCIGGYVAVTGMFGVKQGNGGEPLLRKTDHWLYGCEISEELFGCSHLFSRRGKHPIDGDYPDLSDYQLAVERLNYAKDNLCRRTSDLYDTTDTACDASK
jgi:hypothetical protein